MSDEERHTEGGRPLSGATRNPKGGTGMGSDFSRRT